MASVRFICGTQSVHRALEERLSAFLGTEDTILFGSCFDANGGVFEALLDERDAVISDALNHASIIDGIRLCKAQRLRYANRDMAELEQRLVESAGARYRLIVTDGVFSMDGYLAPLAEICDLAERYDALVMVDDSHAVGFVGADRPRHAGARRRRRPGRHHHRHARQGARRRQRRVRQRPARDRRAAAPAGPAVPVLQQRRPADRGRDAHRARPGRVVGRPAAPGVRQRRRASASGMTAAGFDLLPGEHPIVPVMLGDAALAGRMAAALFERGVYAVAFSFPVVPVGQARIRVQLSAAHTDADIDAAVAAFVAAREAVAGYRLDRDHRLAAHRALDAVDIGALRRTAAVAAVLARVLDLVAHVAPLLEVAWADPPRGDALPSAALADMGGQVAIRREDAAIRDRTVRWRPIRHPPHDDRERHPACGARWALRHRDGGSRAGSAHHAAGGGWVAAAGWPSARRASCSSHLGWACGRAASTSSIAVSGSAPKATVE